MAIGTGQVSISDINVELGVGNADSSLKDRSGKLWKGGETNFATFKETRAFGSNCQYSAPVTAQGTTLRDPSSPYAEIDANGMNADPYSISEWKGYDHEIRSTIGRKGSGTHAEVILTSSNDPSTDVVLHAGNSEFETGTEAGTVDSTSGMNVWCSKDASYGGRVRIFASKPYGSTWTVGGANSGGSVQILGPNNGSGQTTTDNNVALLETYNIITLMEIRGADRITGCQMSLESSMHADGPSGVVKHPNTGSSYSGTEVVATEAPNTSTPQITTTTNLGSTPVGYQIRCGGAFVLDLDEGDEVSRTFGIEFNFKATNNDGVILDSNPSGPSGFQSFKITVYASLYANGQLDEEEGGE